MQIIEKILCKELYSQLTVADRKFFFLKFMYVSQDFDFENDILIKVGNAAD